MLGMGKREIQLLKMIAGGLGVEIDDGLGSNGSAVLTHQRAVDSW